MAKILYSDSLKQYLQTDLQAAYGGESAGIDLYCVQDREIHPMLHGPAGVLSYGRPWESIPANLVPTGIHLILEANEVGLILERGSIVKTPLKVRAGVIDPGFTGELFVNCVNLSSSPVAIKAGTKLPFQILVVPFVRPVAEYVPDLNSALAEIKTSRGQGQIGSSN